MLGWRGDWGRRASDESERLAAWVLSYPAPVNYKAIGINTEDIVELPDGRVGTILDFDDEGTSIYVDFGDYQEWCDMQKVRRIE